MPEHRVLRRIGEGLEGIVEEIELEGYGIAVKKTLRPFHPDPGVIKYRSNYKRMVEESSEEEVNKLLLSRLETKLSIMRDNQDLFLPVLGSGEGWYIMPKVFVYSEYSRDLKGDEAAERLRKRLDEKGLQKVTDIRGPNVGLYQNRDVIVDFMAHPRSRPLNSYLNGEET